MSGHPQAARTGAGRAEIVSTVLVLLLVGLAVFALWPRGADQADPTATQRVAVPVGDAELAPLRAAAGLPPCPTGAGGPGGPLDGVTVGCLGAAGEVDLGAVTAGGPMLINLWASWCAPCVEELPVLAEYAARPGAVPVLLIDLDDDPRAALRLLDDLDIALPSAVDQGNAVRLALDVPPSLPYTYVVDGGGRPTRVDPPVPFRTADAVAAAVAELSPR
ncbi:TlpA disulfide reductase family protein [Pseudonocardia sp.]|uniref:TlpA family protein disulfide reductase n=1 Tax=Pseudonocardia sp. TaxID=60912 RepID=UPI00261A0DFE|nr:TlpA disulfide reductase family protein [Pseudonocardia sp.]